jgi:hypothetical protein
MIVRPRKERREQWTKRTKWQPISVNWLLTPRTYASTIPETSA